MAYGDEYIREAEQILRDTSGRTLFNDIGGNEGTIPNPSFYFLPKRVNLINANQGKKIYSRKIISWGNDNLYPNYTNYLIENSDTANSITSKLDNFLFNGFASGNEIKVNKEGQTLKQVIHCAVKEYSRHNCYILHFGVNSIGNIVSIRNIPVETARVSMQENKTAISLDWQKNNPEIILIDNWVNNEDVVMDRLKVYSNENYKDFNGFIYFYNKSATDIYPKSKIHPVTSSCQYEHEVKEYSLANIQNGFSLSGILTVPEKKSQSTSLREMARTENSFGADVLGSVNAGNLLVYKGVDKDDMPNYIPIERQNIDNIFTSQNQLAGESICRAFSFPPILLGFDKTGMISQKNYQEAKEYVIDMYRNEREELYQSFSFLDYSIFEVNRNEVEQKIITKQDGLPT